MPIFKPKRISNQLEQVQMLVQEAAWLDAATIIRKLPNVEPEEYQAIIEAREAEQMQQMGMMQAMQGVQAPQQEVEEVEGE